MITFKKITLKSKAGLVLINYSHAIVDQEIQNNVGCLEAAGPGRERFLQPRKYQKYPHRSWLGKWLWAFLVKIQVYCYLTHWGRDKMDAISQTTFSRAFSWMKIFEFRLKFHWNLFLRVQLTIFQHWFRWWLGAVQATSHYLNQWWLIYRCINASLGLNELSRGSIYRNSTL